MKTKPNRDFKKQFKLSFIKSLKLGFNIDYIKKRLKNQSYPSDLINDLIEELETDEDIIQLMEEIPKKPGFLEKLKKRLFKLTEEQKIKKIVKLHSIYYNLIIEEKRKLHEEQSDVDDIINNPENKKLINYFIKNKENKIRAFFKKFEALRSIIKRLIEEELKSEIKKQLSKITDFINEKEESLNQEIRNLKQIKIFVNKPDELKKYIQNEKNRLKQKENSLQKTINEISRKSPKFKEAISQL